jgi:hypothetical protein
VVEVTKMTMFRQAAVLGAAVAGLSWVVPPAFADDGGSATPFTASPQTASVTTDTGQSGQVIVSVTADDSDTTVHDWIGTGRAAWTVTPTSCQLDEGESCELTVTFDPQSTGSHPGTLRIANGEVQQTVSLSGMQAAPAVSLVAKPATVTAGKAVSLVASVASEIGHSPIGGQQVELQMRTGSDPWQDLVSAATGANGQAPFKAKPRRTCKFRAVALSSKGVRESHSTAVRVTVD